jgi:cytochrome P450
MGFLDDYDALSQLPDPPKQVAEKQMQLFQTWLVGSPDLLFSELRAYRPIFTTPGPVVVSRFRDVVEVLEYNQIYTVAPWGESMRRDLGGPNFVLGMEDSAEYKREISILRLAVRREDVATATGIAARTAKKLADEGQAKGTFDITDGYARMIPTLFVGEYIGTPGPDPITLMTWQRTMFFDIFFNLTHDPQKQAAAIAASKALSDYNQALIDQAHAANKAGTPYPDNVLGRLLSMQSASPSAFSDERVRVNLSGCIAGVIDNVCSGIVNAMDVLLSRSDALPGAIAAAKSDNDASLTRYVMEALRFEVPAPLLFRLSAEAHILARGTDREATIPANKLIFVSTASAMVDETEIDDPRKFNLDRPMTQYIHFGWGLHECLGKYLAIPLLVQAVKALLRLNNIRRADGPAGQVTREGPFPVAFSVTCDSH